MEGDILNNSVKDILDKPINKGVTIKLKHDIWVDRKKESSRTFRLSTFIQQKIDEEIEKEGAESE